MIAAPLFNAREGSEVEKIYGAVSIGNQWKFLELEGANARIDKADYYIKDVNKIMGILLAMAQAASRPLLPAESLSGFRVRKSISSRTSGNTDLCKREVILFPHPYKH